MYMEPTTSHLQSLQAFSDYVLKSLFLFFYKASLLLPFAQKLFYLVQVKDMLGYCKDHSIAWRSAEIILLSIASYLLTCTTWVT